MHWTDILTHTSIRIYPDEHLKWNNPPQGDCHSTDLSVTVAISHLVERFRAFDYKCSSVYIIGVIFVILTWFASALHIDNAAKDALFAMYA